MTTQNLIDIQETIQSSGWKIYQDEVINTLKFADNHLHRKETTSEDLRYWQGFYDGVQKVFYTPQSLIRQGEKALSENEDK